MRARIETNPFLTTPPNDLDAQPQWHIGRWPSKWIGHPDLNDPPGVMVFRRTFELIDPAAIRVHLSADERYILYVDGERRGRGPERGDRCNWFFESYDLILDPGFHTVVMQVWALGRDAPLAQISVRPGMILACEDPTWNSLLGTGVAPWEVKRLGGYNPFENPIGFGVGCNFSLDGAAFDWGFERGDGDGWVEVAEGPEGISAGGFGQHGQYGMMDEHRLRPALLPAMMEQPWAKGRVRHVEDRSWEGFLRPQAERDLGAEHAGWDGLLYGTSSLTIPAHTTRRVLIDLEDYVCAYPRLICSGGEGAEIRMLWAESLYEGELASWRAAYRGTKGNRDAIEGKTFIGTGDRFLPDGGSERAFEPLWWRAGRYVEVQVETQEAPLTLNALTFLETRYPLSPETQFRADDDRLTDIWPLMVRALQMCAHETYMDCPYYEQLMYVGDTRLEILVTYCLTGDTRLPRKAIEMFDVSRLPNHLTQSRYPCRHTQVIPPFSLWWCGLVFDFAKWRDDPAFVRRMMPGVREILDAFASYRNAEGLVEAPPGWNYMDWVREPGWHTGTPPDGEAGVSGILNWHYVLMLTRVAELEAWLGEPENAARWRRYASEVAEAAMTTFWDESRGLLADDITHTYFSEHSQCLALLGDRIGSEKRARLIEGLLDDGDLARTTIYFSHYLFETLRLVGRVDRIFERLETWFELPDLGFRTTREAPEPSRSDCHAWGAHPIYHSYATILGVRPGDFGFETVEIRPALGPLTSIEATLPHPRGEIAVTLEREGEMGLSGEVRLPKGLRGFLHYGGHALVLEPGAQSIDLGVRG